jgi:beta-lactamase regulating signal transducer with metallopeptidase domain
MLPQWTVIGLQATVAIALAFAVCALTRHARASFRHAVYAALFTLLLVLPLSKRVMPGVQLRVAVPPPSVTTAVATPTPHVLSSQPETAVMWRPSLSDIYLAGVLFLLGSLAVGVRRLRQWAADGEVWLDGTRMATEIACANGVRRALLVVISSDVSVPMTFGFRRQTIILPEAARNWNAGLVQRAMRHEIEHVGRHDWILQLMARVTCAVYWPHLFVWVAWRRFCVEAERACDDAVVGAFEPSTYASELVALARTLTRRTRVPALAMAGPTRLSERITAILDPQQSRGRHGRFASLTTIAAAAAMFAVFGSVRVVAAALTDEKPAVTRSAYDGDDVVKAAERGNVNRLGMMLDRGDFKINQTFDGDGTALLITAKYGHVEAVRYLLDRGADPNVPSDGDGNPLIAAASRNQRATAALLLDRRARIDDIVDGDETALITAARMGHVEMVRFLIDRGANVNLGVEVDTNEGDRVVHERRTALRMARRAGSAEMVDMLLKAGAGD